ncbi:MAG TPA: hypothetical protein VEL76_40075 [Gemmataceae bacterium]|nr:hypothetical protein [Gemmataceae bacterium]
MAVDELHDQIRPSFFQAEIQAADNVRMLQRVGGQELLLKALERDGVGRLFDRHHLDGHDLPRLLMASPVDAPHAAAADRLQEFVRTHPHGGDQGKAW